MATFYDGRPYTCLFNQHICCEHEFNEELCKHCGWNPEEDQRRRLKRVMRKDLAKAYSGEIYFRDKQIEQLHLQIDKLMKRNERLRKLLDESIEDSV